MPKDLPFPTATENPASTEPQSAAAHIVDAPVHTGRLDADLILADDLDGITESLFGSGNLNYLLLQARQTDAAAMGNGFDSASAMHADPAIALAAIAAAQQAVLDAQTIENAFSATAQASANGAGLSHANALSSGNGSGDGLGSISVNASAFSPVTAGDQPASVSATTQVTNNNNNNGSDNDGNNNGNDGNGNNNNNDDDNNNNNGGDNNPPGGNDDNNNGGNGDNGGNNGGNDDIDILGENNIGLPVVDINLDPIENIVGDIDLGVGIGFDPDTGITVDIDTVLLDIPLLNGEINVDIPLLNPVIGEVLVILDPILTAVTDITQPIIDGLSTTVESVIGSIFGNPPPMNGDYDLSVHTDLGIPHIDINLDVIENIIGDIDILVTFAHGENGIDIGLDSIFADLPIANADVHVDIPLVTPVVEGVLDPTADLLSHVTNPDTLSDLFNNPGEALPDLLDTAAQSVADIVEGTVGGVLETVQNTLDNLGQTDTSPDDYDIAIGTNLGLPPIDINLDPIENIVGDIDIGPSLAITESGITVGMDLELLGIDVLNNAEVTLDVPLVMPVVADTLGVVQDVLGCTEDSDNIVNGAITLIEDTAEGVAGLVGGILSGNPSGGDGDGCNNDASWPELGNGLVHGLVDGLGDILGGQGDGALHLPDPVGNIVEGLGLLPSGSDHGGGLLSGLFNGHGGGLFG